MQQLPPGNVARYWRHQGFDWNYHSIYSSLSQGMEMLFLVAFAIGRHPAAAMVHMAFQATLPLLILVSVADSSSRGSARSRGRRFTPAPWWGSRGSRRITTLQLQLLFLHNLSD